MSLQVDEKIISEKMSYYIGERSLGFYCYIIRHGTFYFYVGFLILIHIFDSYIFLSIPMIITVKSIFEIHTSYKYFLLLWANLHF